MLQYFEYLPSVPLRPYINCFWWMESSGTRNRGLQWDRTLPDGCLEMVFHLADPMLRKDLNGSVAGEARGILIGQTTRPYLFAATGTVRMLGVRFFPHTAALWFGRRIAEFNDSSVDLEAIVPPADQLPLNAFGEAATAEAAVNALESYFLRRLGRFSVAGPDAYVQHVCQAILASRGNLAISELGRELGISNRYLERLFFARVGVSPKFFARIMRFQGIFQNLSGEDPFTLVEVAHEAGYYDQSHFARDFRQFTGLSPRDFLRERHPMSQHFIEPANCSYLYNFASPVSA